MRIELSSSQSCEAAAFRFDPNNYAAKTSHALAAATPAHRSQTDTHTRTHGDPHTAVLCLAFRYSNFLYTIS